MILKMETFQRFQTFERFRKKIGNKRGMRRKSLFIFWIIILFLSNLSAQVGGNQKKQLLTLIFPTKLDTISLSKIRISGNTRVNAKVSINGELIRVYPSGAFVGRVALDYGENEIKIFAADSMADTTVVLKIFRRLPIPVSPEKPAEIDPRIMWPDEDVILMSGDYLEVRIKGSPGGRAKFKIDKLCKNIPMIELPPKDAAGMRGIYSGVVRLESKKPIYDKQVEFELRARDGSKAKAKSKGRVTVLSGKIPRVGVTKSSTYLKSTPYALSVMTILPAGIRLHIVGKIGGHYKIRLSDGIYGFVSVPDVHLLPPGVPLPKTTISLPSVSVKRDWIQLSMRVNTFCPYTVQQTVDPAILELVVYGAHLISQWITYPEIDSTIKLIRWQQPSADVFKLIVELNQKQQWGYRVRFSGNRMILEIRRAPKIAEPPKSPVAGLIFALDAGHGGDELGAVGATGLLEKNVNLIYAKKLAALLDSAGAKVILTRENDVKMSLADRMEKARQANAHFFIWLHNNAVGNSSDAAAVRGTSTYFTIPQNQALAWEIYPYLVNLGLRPFGKVQSDYYVTRQTDMLIVLVEGAFMSNPEDEMMLAEEQFLDKLARAVFNGLESFCRKQLELQKREN